MSLSVEQILKEYEIIKTHKNDPDFKAKFTNGNIKLGKMGVWSTLKGNDPISAPSLSTTTPIMGTCGNHCTNCTNSCYVNKSYRIYPSVVQRHAINTLILRHDPAKASSDLREQLNKMRTPYSTIRINQSGELSCPNNIIMWEDLAKDYPNIEFYLYTKAYEIVEPEILANKIPPNLTILYSIWENQGVAEFLKVKDYPNVKAFVYHGKNSNPNSKALPQTYCHAYDAKGKMNHNITCDKCKMCYDRNNNHKIIGCYDH